MMNWQSRLTNKTFWVALVSAIVLLTQQLGLNIFPDNWADILNTILTILMILGIIIDPTTEGITDKNREVLPESIDEVEEDKEV